MNQKNKYILYGAGSVVIIFVVMILIRTLVKGIPIEEGIKDWSNWFVAVGGGVGGAWAKWNKDKKGQK